MAIASKYSGLNFSQLMELDIITFNILVRDAFVAKMKETEEGRAYLEDCWRLKQTTPDRKTLRDKFGG